MPPPHPRTATQCYPAETARPCSTQTAPSAAAFPAGQGPLDTNSILFLQYDSLAWTPQTIAYLSFTDHHYVVHTARRSDCTPTSSADLNVNWTFGVLALPGTFAVFADERDAGSPNVTDGANYLIGLH